MQRLAVLLFLALLLAGCGTDPRDVADAYKIQILADQAAADQAQIRTQAAERFALAQVEQAQISAERIRVQNTVLHYLAFFVTVSASVAVVAMGVGFSWGVIGTGKAWARAANVKANLISLPKDTRQYPVILAYVGGGRYNLANPNTGSLMTLDTRRNPDRQLIAAAGAVQLAGVVTQEAGRSSDPAGMALYQPVVINAQDERVEVSHD
jgi:hypothetical protein